LNYKEKS
ncbi:hypothetical protein FOXB_16345, partial [Fusarium oxysporum f. sp. conglutinans Fo5176]